MKTPHDILFERHQDSKPKLDMIRSDVVALCREARRPAPFGNILKTFLLLLWRELIMPSRRTWAGLAVTWVLILAVNVALRDPGQPSSSIKVSAPDLMSFQDQQKMLNELLADRSLPVDGDRRQSFSPRPRSERTFVAMT
jgi:hypothetical protein